ncbi:Signal transduction histidine kinase [Mucilaginibacter gossypiicola]|uniref:histidine kinase n=1 Tax=Mucilaginibacter gossypiicola TaxID=551995 RepID=A0A1H8RYR2_9SPHI|nr:HAMP domain-containing sensor histidine kinase [Mucilaginibacter gossypiicola]SEO71515.1 Signal transduction histidine kinase [Mucilaginibacter gossypiicola]
MSFSEKGKLSGDDVHLTPLINDLDTGIWKYNFNTREVKWSTGFYKVLDFQLNEIECNAYTFFEHLLYHGDKPAFLNAINNRVAENAPPLQLRFLTKKNGYQWFETTIRKQDNEHGCIAYGSLVNINRYKHNDLLSAHNQVINDDAFKTARLGSWEINAQSTDTIQLSTQVYDLFDLQNQLNLSVEEFISFFEPPYRPVLQDAINLTLEHSRPFDIDLLLRSAKNNMLWLKVKAVPVINHFGKCTSVKGIVQDIDSEKRKLLKLEQSINLLTDQNRRLQNFAYIVSHNLRSHTGNLQFMVNLFEQTETSEEREEIFSHIKTISDSLDLTIEHINEIVKIQTEITKERKMVELEPMFKNICSALKNNIEAINARIEGNFTQCPEISYIPAYMESILQNLLTNSLKYSHPDRQPVIKCYTLTEGNHIYLIFEDNGLGIDLERYGDKIFGMYKTFHQNTDAKGIGLFITRNQIEALGGNIKVDSAVNIGTKFTIRLA